MGSKTTPPSLSLKDILHTWWPLAASWLLMGLELPALSAIVARLAEPEINLAAYGGVVFPLALIIEAPIVMLLAASTALSKDWSSYRKLYIFMMITSALLTGIHIYTAFTPFYYTVVKEWIHAPEEIIEPARIGLMIMTPWTWSIAYRRFQQGALIRFGHSRAVGVGTAIRLGADMLVLSIGYLVHTIPGIVVATSAVTVGVVSEAVYAGLRIRPVLQNQIKKAPSVEPPLTAWGFALFYIPLMLTSFLTLLVQPIGSAALSRMPQALESLAVWPVVTGLIFMLRSLGIAFNEVVVALLDEPLSTASLQRFVGILALGTTMMLLAVTATPLAGIWFKRVSALSPYLAQLARLGLWIALPIPALNALQSWYQGAILNSHRTRGITESIILFLGTVILVLNEGISKGYSIGLFIGLLAFAFGMLNQTLWLWLRSRPAIRATNERDKHMLAVNPHQP
jgi:hypothetical protein